MESALWETYWANPTDSNRNAVIAEHVPLALRYGTSLAAGWQPADADEIRSVALLALIKAVTTWRPEKGAGFTGWAWKVIQNEVSSWVRSRRAKGHRRAAGQPLTMALPDGDLGVASVTRTPADAVAERDERIFVRRQNSALPLPYRLVVRWHVIRGMTLEEIGRRLGHGKPWACEVYHKGLKMLRERLHERDSKPQ